MALCLRTVSAKKARHQKQAMTMDDFLRGAMAMAFWVIGLFFFKFWTRTRDRLFLIFACSFVLLGVTRLGISLTDANEGEIWYVVRLIAFLLLLYAIWDKNRPRHVATKEQQAS